MKDRDFEDLCESIRQAGEMRRGSAMSDTNVLAEAIIRVIDAKTAYEREADIIGEDGHTGTPSISTKMQLALALGNLHAVCAAVLRDE